MYAKFGGGTFCTESFLQPPGCSYEVTTALALCSSQMPVRPFQTSPRPCHPSALTPAAAAAKSLQSCPTLCDPTDGSPPGFPVPGILQARTLECELRRHSRVTTGISAFPLGWPWEGNGNPVQCSCLENPRDGEAWWAAVCGVAQRRTQLKQLTLPSLPGALASKPALFTFITLS